MSSRSSAGKCWTVFKCIESYQTISKFTRRQSSLHSLHNLCACIWCGRWSICHCSSTFLSSPHCSVTVLLHKLSRARCTQLWMLSKCFCRGEWGAHASCGIGFLFQTGAREDTNENEGNVEELPYSYPAGWKFRAVKGIVRWSAENKNKMFKIYILKNWHNNMTELLLWYTSYTCFCLTCQTYVREFKWALHPHSFYLFMSLFVSSHWRFSNCHIELLPSPLLSTAAGPQGV